MPTDSLEVVVVIMEVDEVHILFIPGAGLLKAGARFISHMSKTHFDNYLSVYGIFLPFRFHKILKLHFTFPFNPL